MENYNITEAFKALDEVAEIELQDLEPKKSIFSLNDEEDVEELKSLMDIDEVEEEDPIEMIIDIDAEDEEELKDTYVGDVILQCNVCKSLIYKPEDQLVKDETVEDKDVFNVDEECPHCHKLLGYTLIGKVAPYDKEESKELQAEGEAGEDFEDEVFNSTETEPAEDVDFEEEEEVEVKKESLEEEPKQGVLNESCDKSLEKVGVNEGISYYLHNEEDDVVDTFSSKKKALDAAKKFGAKCSVKLWDDDESELIASFDEKGKEIKEACEEAMFDNVKFDKEVFGKYFDENGHLIPELEKEYWKAVEDHRRKKEVSEDTVKHDGKWVNKGEEGTHGKFKTKKEADAQRKAMFANGYKGESLEEAKEVFAIKKKNIENGEEKVIEVERVDDADLAQKKADEIEGAWVEKIEEECKDESCDEACKEECEENCEESLVIENIDEELFDKLVNNYIKEVYDNIDSYTTTGGSVDNKNNKVVLEGVIKFKSGKEQNTKFIFEEAKLTKKGKIKLKGINETFAKMKKAFTLQGSLKDQNLLAESFTYNYKVNSNNELRRIYGTERIPMNEELKLISDISDYRPWAGAVNTYNKIVDAGMLDVLEATLEDSYPEGMTMTELNDMLWFDGDDILEMLGLKDEEIEESCKTEEACQKEECELKEGSKEIDRIGFKSLIKYDDPVFAGASHGVLNDGNFVEKFWADSDEEAIKKFRGEADESCKEELEANTDFAMDQKVDKVFNELQDLAIEAKEKGEDYTADNLLDASSLLDDKKITEECKDESCELKEEADLPAEIIDEIHDTVDYFFSPDFKAILDEDDWKDFIITLLNEPAISEEGIANSFEDCSSDLRALLDTDKEPLIYEEAKRYLGTKMAELEEACKNEACEEELADDHHMRSELADVSGDLIDLSIEARDKGELKTSEKIMDAVDDLDQENLMEDINSVVINQGEEDEIKLESGDIKEVEVKEEDGKKVIEVEQEPSLEDLDAEPYLSNVEDEIESEFNKGEAAPVEAPVEMIAPVEDEEAVSDEEAAAEIEAEFNQE